MDTTIKDIESSNEYNETEVLHKDELNQKYTKIMIERGG